MDFPDAAEPTAFLARPKVPEEFFDPLIAITAAGDVFSPGGWFLKLAELMLPTDPVEWAQEQLVGDWKAYAACSQAWRNAGRACGAIARNVEAGSKRIDATWDGHAAEAAIDYFEALRKNLDDVQGALDTMAEEYRVVTESIARTGQAIGGCISAIIDALVSISVTTAASTALGWTGGAAALGYALGAMEVQVILKEWERMSLLVNAAQLAMNTSYSVMGRTGGEILARVHALPVPRASYDHPAV
ncbi:hypothetical protein LE181_06105 [Streptomyces sp. SCA3-4]|uniref:WXG100 family type VII secretion target n=1 Tax=Streptomyces sichuanensis TaxID=2871810 RepID=UPI001CE2F410|nr:hypothetical protein [Streptomyces sichuanensis]MCA6091739.1 hypothetical protein [Streptomyces sichuanensis]